MLASGGLLLVTLLLIAPLANIGVFMLRTSTDADGAFNASGLEGDELRALAAWLESLK